MTLPELLWRRYSGMDSTYLSMAGSSSQAFIRVNEAQGSGCDARMVGVVGVVGSLLFAIDDVSTINISSCRPESRRRHRLTGWRNSRPISHRRLWLWLGCGCGCGWRQWVNKNPRGLWLLSFPREDGLGLLAWWRGPLSRYLIPHVLGRAWVPLRRDVWGSVRGHVVARRRHVQCLGL